MGIFGVGYLASIIVSRFRKNKDADEEKLMSNKEGGLKTSRESVIEESLNTHKT